MKVKFLLEEIKEDSKPQNFNIEKKGNKFFIKNKDGECVKGSREMGYSSLEAASFDLLDFKNSSFKKLEFPDKKKKVDDFVKKYKTENDVKDKKPIKKFGFEQFGFSED